MSLVAEAKVYVRGYHRKNGTYVSFHYRSSPDRSFHNNWSTKGNINPYTGRRGSKIYSARNSSYLSSSGKLLGFANRETGEGKIYNTEIAPSEPASHSFKSNRTKDEIFLEDIRNIEECDNFLNSQKLETESKIDELEINISLLATEINELKSEIVSIREK